jgi:hypothetical protein
VRHELPEKGSRKKRCTEIAKPGTHPQQAPGGIQISQLENSCAAPAQRLRDDDFFVDRRPELREEDFFAELFFFEELRVLLRCDPDELLFDELLFFAADFFLGTFPPALRASESPMAIACFRLVTFFPLRPLFSLPCFIARISSPTFFCAFAPYFLPPDFFEELFFVAIHLLLSAVLGSRAGWRGCAKK